jgi:predicted amidohydrolase
MNNNKVTVTLIQGDLAPHADSDNLHYFSNLIQSIKDETDFIILPELFTRGYSPDIRSTAETMNGKTVTWMLQQAQLKKANIIGSMVIKEENKYFNRLIWAQPDGKTHYYDKRHLFRMVDEHKILNDGREKIIVEYRGWKICPLVCYDLRFPVWSRKRDRDEYDMLIYVANWPESRSYHWKSLLIARAIENQSWVIGVNRTGMDVNNIYFRGDSLIVDPRGKIVSDLQDGEKVITRTVSKSAVEEYRREFPTWMDADKFEIL